MKKKAIEKVPFLNAQKHGNRPFVLVTACKNVGHEMHLFLEVYKNKKTDLQIPIVRCIFTKKDWGMYWPEQEVWSSCKLEDEYGRLRWEPTNKKKGESTYISEKDYNRILGFTKKERYQWKDWYDYLRELQDSIKYDRWKRGEQRKNIALQERCAEIKPLPDGFMKWVKTGLFRYDDNFIYYKRNGRTATFTCSHCGNTYTSAIKQTEGIEGQAEHVIKVPKHGYPGKCEWCDAMGIYKAAGKTKGVYGIQKKCYVGQAYRQQGAVIRYIEVEKILRTGEPESYIVSEIARNYFERGEKVITDYHLYNNYSGKSQWCYHNIGGMNNISQQPGALYPGSYQDLKGTLLQYTGVENYLIKYGTEAIKDYMEEYLEHPYLEMLSKMGLYELAKDIVSGYSSKVKCETAKKPDMLLGIYKYRIKLLIKFNGCTDMLKVLQIEKEGGYCWTEEQCEKLMMINPDRENLGLALSLMSVQQLLNRVEKYAGCEFNCGCSTALGRLRHTGVTYLDYLRLREVLGYDLGNSIFAYPRDVEAAHAAMVLEVHKGELDKRIREAESKFNKIKSKYRTLRKQYYYEDDDYLIRPAKSAKEIIEEGRILHHCVGGDGYLRKHNQGESFILMLRAQGDSEVPYITVEIRETKIVQWYGAYDKKPDKEHIEKWLDNYVNILKRQLVEGLKQGNAQMLQMAAG